MNPENLDYQAKIITPSKQLYQQLSTQADELFAQAKESAIELHAQIAESGLDLYQHPTETATRWQAQAVEKGNELYSILNTEIIPSAQADYIQLVSNVTNYGIRSRESFQVFLDNPEKVTVEAFTAFNQALTLFIDKSVNVSSIILDELSAKADEIITLLIEQPIQTVENIYYDSLATLLNNYFEIVSSLIITS
ncbi:hypothetical protein [Methyloprofundus sp.]|uniref:hypothetical protein n=1 Tax=Methyloprofundus sp. TaxID=2020875 RepID=UPI003D151675